MPEPTFDVDKQGLAKLLERRGKEFIIYELLQNAWDENTSAVTVAMASLSRGKTTIVVEDDNPEGFADLSHAYTLFAESSKKADPEKRGRFNLGEKLVIAAAERSSISTTKGVVLFNENGRTVMTNKTARRGTGSMFEGVFRITKDEVEDIARKVRLCIPPLHITTLFCGEQLPHRKPIVEFTETLPTEIADDEGYLRRTQRLTTVRVYEPLEGETAMLYEMGIPVVETSDRYHVDVQQKVPLNTDRDNVTPSYLRAIRAYVLNATANLLTKEEASAAWTNDALEHGGMTDEATIALLDRRFGEKRVIYDPSDQEANKIAARMGYTVIPGGTFSKKQWVTVRETGAAVAAGQVTPSAKCYAENGRPENVISFADWTQNQRDTVTYLHRITNELMKVEITFRIVREPQVAWAANYGSRRLTLNLGKLGHKWFERTGSNEQLALLLHELGHEYTGDHLSKHFADSVAMLGVNLARLVQQGDIEL